MKWAYVEEIYEAAAQVEGCSFNHEVARGGKLENATFTSSAQPRLRGQLE